MKHHPISDPGTWVVPCQVLEKSASPAVGALVFIPLALASPAAI